MEVVMIERWDDDLAVQIPDAIVAALELSEGDEVELAAGEDGGIVIRRRET